MSNSIQYTVKKSSGWQEVGSGFTAGMMSTSGDCMFCMAASSPSLSYGHRTTPAGVNFTKAAGDKLFVLSDISDSVIVVITPE